MEMWELVARERIRDTLALYTWSGDGLRLDDLASAFCEDGELEVRGQEPLRGRAAIVDFLGGVATDADVVASAGDVRRIVRHNVTNIRFTSVEPTAAQVESYFTVLTELGLDHYGRYRTAEPVLDQEATARNVDKKGKALGPVSRDAPVDATGLVALVGDVVSNAAPRLHWDFLTGLPSRFAERAGILPGIVGSTYLLLLTGAFALPVGIGAAIYLEEYATESRWTRLIELNIANLAGVPSILFGLIGPDRAAGEHLKCLARISRALRDDAVRARLIQASDPESALQIVLEVDGG